MDKIDIALKRPGLGILLLNASAIALLQSGLRYFDLARSGWTRLAIACFGLGIMAGVFCLFTEMVTPAGVLIPPWRDPRDFRTRLLEIVKRKQWVAIAALAYGIFLAILSAITGTALLAVLGFLLLALAAVLIVLIGERLRQEGLDAGYPDPHPEQVNFRRFDTAQLPIHRLLLAVGLILFALGVVASVNQPFLSAAGDVSNTVENAIGKTGDGDPQPADGNRAGDGNQAGEQGTPANTNGTVGGPDPGDNGSGPSPEATGPDPVTTIEAPADLLFAFDSFALEPNAETRLGEMAERIRRERNSGPIRVVGHTDSVGPEDYNINLSHARAGGVAEWLKTRGGLSGFPFDIQGRGESDPADRSDSPEAAQRNRRVAISYTRAPGGSRR
jgi:outer membrane protein OmpA-like peptidoglycan-associated protein